MSKTLLQRVHGAYRQGLPFICLLTGAWVWGLIWYPYRALQEVGVPPALATAANYGVALLLGLVFFARSCRRLSRRDGFWLLLLILAAGWTNLGYTLAVVHGTVMRVLLLFYLAPLWTVLFARLLLGEKLNRYGAGVMAMSLLGAGIMLWQPGAGWPWPACAAEWWGLTAGMMFALMNVLVRKLHEVPLPMKSLGVWLGVSLLSALILPGQTIAWASLAQAPWWAWGLLLGLGVVIMAVNMVVQHGLNLVPASQAIVVMLFELVVAAVSAGWLAHEALTWREWLGGALIVAASLFSVKLGGVDSPAHPTETA